MSELRVGSGSEQEAESRTRVGVKGGKKRGDWGEDKKTGDWERDEPRKWVRTGDM